MRWTHVKRRRPEVVADGAPMIDEPPPTTLASLVPPQLLRSSTLDADELLSSPLPRQLSHRQLARLLWRADYWPIFLATLEQFSDVSAPMATIFEQLRGRRRAEVDHAAALRLVSSVVSAVQVRARRAPLLTAHTCAALLRSCALKAWWKAAFIKESPCMSSPERGACLARVAPMSPLPLLTKIYTTPRGQAKPLRKFLLPSPLTLTLTLQPPPPLHLHSLTHTHTCSHSHLLIRFHLRCRVKSRKTHCHFRWSPSPSPF